MSNNIIVVYRQPLVTIAENVSLHISSSGLRSLKKGSSVVVYDDKLKSFTHTGTVKRSRTSKTEQVREFLTGRTVEFTQSTSANCRVYHIETEIMDDPLSLQDALKLDLTFTTPIEGSKIKESSPLHRRLSTKIIPEPTYVSITDISTDYCGKAIVNGTAGSFVFGAFLVPMNKTQRTAFKSMGSRLKHGYFIEIQVNINDAIELI